MTRIVEAGFRRWQKRMEEFGKGNVKNNNVLNKYRLRMLGQAFTRYKEFLKESRTQSKNEQQAENIKQTFLNLRKKRVF